MSSLPKDSDLAGDSSWESGRRRSRRKGNGNDVAPHVEHDSAGPHVEDFLNVLPALGPTTKSSLNCTKPSCTCLWRVDLPPSQKQSSEGLRNQRPTMSLTARERDRGSAPRILGHSTSDKMGGCYACLQMYAWIRGIPFLSPTSVIPLEP